MNMDKTNMDKTGMDTMGMDMDMMKSYFYTSSKVTVLFAKFKVTSTLGICVAGIIMVLLSLVNEGIKCLRLHLIEKEITESTIKRRSWKDHGLQTLLYITEMVFSYFLMLAVMTYNLWLGLSVLAGITCGYFLCSVLTKHKHILYRCLLMESHKTQHMTKNIKLTATKEEIEALETTI